MDVLLTNVQLIISTLTLSPISRPPVLPFGLDSSTELLLKIEFLIKPVDGPKIAPPPEWD